MIIMKAIIAVIIIRMKIGYNSKSGHVQKKTIVVLKNQ